GAAGDDVEAAFEERAHHGPGVLHHFFLVVDEVLAHGFFEAHGLGGDDVHERAALVFRKHGKVQAFVQFFVAAVGQDDAAARAAQGLVGGGGDHVGGRQRAGVYAGGHEASHVRHVHHEPGADLV